MQREFVPPETCRQFMLDDSAVRFIMGPVGSGKTTACIYEILRRCAQQTPGPDGIRRTRWAIVRNTLQQIKTTVLKDIEQLLQGIIRFKVSDSTIYVQGADIYSEWLLIPLDTVEDQRRLLSTQLTGAYVNEWREVDPSLVMALRGRLGRFPSKAVVAPTWHGLIADSNPGTMDSPWYELLELDLPNKWAFFKQPDALSPLGENKANLPEDYYEALQDGASEDWIRMHVHGEWGISLSGAAVFRSSFNPEFHISDTELEPVSGYPLLIAQDFGRTPTSLVCQVDHRGRLLILEELTSEDMGLEQFCTEKLKPALHSDRFYGYPVHLVGDPAGRTKSQLYEESAFELLSRVGFKAHPAPTNKIEPRLRAVEGLLLRQQDGGPALVIDGAKCPMLIKALKAMYKYRRKKGGELDTHSPEKLHPWSDLADCLQYACLVVDSRILGRVMQDFNRGAPVVEEPFSEAAWT